MSFVCVHVNIKKCNKQIRLYDILWNEGDRYIKRYNPFPEMYPVVGSKKIPETSVSEGFACFFLGGSSDIPKMGAKPESTEC